MKLVNEKGKLFGLINLVDLLILLAVVLAVFAVGYKVLAKPVTAAVVPDQEVTVTMRVRGAMPYLVEELKLQEGARLVAGNDFAPGSNASVEAVPYVLTATAADGTLVEATDPLKNDVMITVKGTGNPNDPILKIGNQEVRAGRDFIVKTNRVVCVFPGVADERTEKGI